MTLKETLTKIRNEFEEEGQVLETLKSISPSQLKIISEEQLPLSYTRLEEGKDYLKQYPNAPLIIENIAWHEDSIAFWKANIGYAERDILFRNCLNNEYGVEVNV